VKYVIAPLVGVVMVLALLAWWWRRSRSPLVPFGALWILLPMTPLLNLSVLPMGDFVHDRYMYLPSVGLALLGGMALAKLDARKLVGKPAGSVAAVAIACGFAAGTVTQSLPWADDVPLYRHAMAIAPNHDLPPNKLASALVQRGMYAEGIRLYRVVLGGDPDFWYANWRMGYAQYQTGHYNEAEKYLSRASVLHPTAEEFYCLGMTTMKLGQMDAAERAFSEAIRLQPGGMGYRYAMGMALKQQGKLMPALESFRAELVVNPSNAAARQAVEEASKEAVTK
jgi:tetratricopeptide (TPR) repeat protein